MPREPKFPSRSEKQQVCENFSFLKHPIVHLIKLSIFNPAILLGISSRKRKTHVFVQSWAKNAPTRLIDNDPNDQVHQMPINVSIHGLLCNH